MTIEWTNALSVGVKELDLHHQELFRKVDQLLAACREGRGSAEVHHLVLFLQNYVSMHFKTEERLMLEAGYPGYFAHKHQHREFKLDLARFIRTLEQSKPTVNLILAINRTMVQWLVIHESQSDGLFGEFLRGRGEWRSRLLPGRTEDRQYWIQAE